MVATTRLHAVGAGGTGSQEGDPRAATRWRQISQSLRLQGEPTSTSGLALNPGLFHEWSAQYPHKTFVREKRNQGSCQRRALGVYTWDNARGHDHHPGPCPRQIGDIRRSRAQTAELPWSPFQWWMDDTWMMVETKLRVPPWLAIATIVKGHHMSTPCAAWGRPRCPHVMTTTLCVNAQELR